MKKAMACMVLVSLMGMLAGCAVGKQVVHTITGPDGDYLLIESPKSADLAQYTKIEVAPFENDLPRYISTVLSDAVQTNAVKTLKKDGFFESVKAVEGAGRASADDALLVTGTLFDMNTGAMGGIGESKILGSGDFMIGLVEIKDSAGKTVIKANVRGAVKSLTDDEEADLARGYAEGIRKLLEGTFKMKR